MNFNHMFQPTGQTTRRISRRLANSGKRRLALTAGTLAMSLLLSGCGNLSVMLDTLLLDPTAPAPYYTPVDHDTPDGIQNSNTDNTQSADPGNSAQGNVQPNDAQNANADGNPPAANTDQAVGADPAPAGNDPAANNDGQLTIADNSPNTNTSPSVSQPASDTPTQPNNTPAPASPTTAANPQFAGGDMMAEGDGNVDAPEPHLPPMADPDGRVPLYEEYSYFLPSLSDHEKANLYALYEGISSFEENIQLPSPASIQEVKDLFAFLNNECPELMQLGLTWRQRSNFLGSVISIQPTYRMDEETYWEQRNAVEALLHEFHTWLDGCTDYEIELFLYNYIIENCDYSIEEENCESAYGALIGGAAKCDGRAEALVWGLRSFGITSSVITGSEHAWVLAQIDGFDYNVDPTYDDNEIDGSQLTCTYAHFNIPESAIADDPYPADEIFIRRGYPATVRWDANYHVRSGYWVAAGQDPNSQFMAQLSNAAAEDEGVINLRFESAEDFEAVKEVYSDWIQSFLNQNGLSCHITTYGSDDDNILFLKIRFS